MPLALPASASRARRCKQLRVMAASAAALVGSGASSPGSAAEFELGGARLSTKATLTFGQAVRDSERNPEVLNRLNALAVQTVGTSAGGRNQDDGNLNFDKGDPVSTVLKAYGEARLAYAPFTLVLAGKAWHDYTLEDKSLPWGNLANGLRSDRPLSDGGFDQRSRFSGAVLQDAYLQLDHALGDARVAWRLGQQTLGWGGPSLLGGGMRLVDAVDTPAARRPGSIAAENTAPALALRGTADWPSGWRIDGFAQFSFEPNASTVCGTFYSVADYLDGDCDKSVLGAAANDRDNLAAGSYLKRSDVIKPSGGGQYGLALGYSAPAKAWSTTLYAATVHNRALSYNMIKTRRATGAPVIAGDPGGLNAMYQIEYAKDVHFVGIEAMWQLGAGTLQAELTHSPNLPVPLNAGDLVGAFASLPSVAAILRADERATPLGGQFKGYDRLKVSDARLGWSRSWRGLAGAEDFQFRAELAAKFVHGLPDVTIRRYRRPDVYGNGPVAGVCAGASPDSKQCSTDGYVTARAYGVRLRASAGYRVADGWLLTPTLAFGQDLKGVSFDNALGEGRRTLLAALRLGGRWGFAEFALNHVWGNPFDNAGDRDTLAFVVGTSF